MRCGRPLRRPVVVRYRNRSRAERTSQSVSFGCIPTLFHQNGRYHEQAADLGWMPSMNREVEARTLLRSHSWGTAETGMASGQAVTLRLGGCGVESTDVWGLAAAL